MNFAIDEIHESIVSMLAPDSLLHQVKRIGNPCQGIVDFMGDISREVAQRREFFRLRPLGFKLLNPRRSALTHALLQLTLHLQQGLLRRRRSVMS